MRIFNTVLFFLLLGCSAVAYDMPPGIPGYGTWNGSDPLEMSRPSQPGGWPSAEVAGYYYIDNTNGAATDTGNPYGYPDKPRATIPEQTYAAGDYVEVRGGPYYWRIGDSEVDLDFPGTAANPIWFVGDPTVNTELQGSIEINGSHLIVENFDIKRDTVANRHGRIGLGGDADGDCEYVVVRDCVFQGDGTFHNGSSSAISMIGSSGDEVNNIAVFQCQIFDQDDYTYTILTDEDDSHGILPGQYSNNIWIIDNDIYHCAGDAIQITGNNAAGDARSQYVYIGDNLMYQCGENAVDVKSSLDVIMSSNTMHTYVDANGSDGSAVVVQEEGGDGSDNVWVLFNEIYSAVIGIRAEEGVTNVYVIGNIIRDTVVHPTVNNYSHAIYFRGNGTEMYAIDNTFHNTVEDMIGWDNQPLAVLHGNVYGERQDNSRYSFEGEGAQTGGSSSDYSFFDSANTFNARWYPTTYASLATLQAGGEDTNSDEDDPLFVDEAGNDFAPDTGSPLIDASTEHAAYDDFFTRYGLSIEVDFNGLARPDNGAWDIGAIEYDSSQAWEYPGVPYTDWEYDPFTYAAPSRPAEWPSAPKAGFYFVEKDHPSATDDDQGAGDLDDGFRRYGYPDLPRETMPVPGLTSGSFSAGDVVWIKGGEWDSIKGSTNTWQMTFSGGSSNPCWLYGDPDDKPTFNYNPIGIGGTYTFVENLVWMGPNNSQNTLFFTGSNSADTHHIAIRNCHFEDLNWVSGGGAIVGCLGLDNGQEHHDIVYYNNVFKNCGANVPWYFASEVTEITKGTGVIDEVQRISFDPWPTGGYYYIEWEGDQNSSLINVGAGAATGATLQTQLRTITGLGSVNVTEINTDGPHVYDVEFAGTTGDQTMLFIDEGSWSGGTVNPNGALKNDDDHHGFKVDGTTAAADGEVYRVWIIDNKAVPGSTPSSIDGLYKALGGTFCQVGDANPPSGANNLIFVAGNIGSHVRQAHSSVKRAEKVVFSSNYSVDTDVQGATGVSFNSKYSFRPDVWIVANEATRTGGGAHLGSDSGPDASIYVVGNIFYDMHKRDADTGWRHGGVSMWDFYGQNYVINNTFDELTHGVVTAGRSGAFADSDSEFHIYNNIFTNISSPGGVDTTSRPVTISNRNGGGGNTPFTLYVENNMFDDFELLDQDVTYTSIASFNNAPQDPDGGDAAVAPSTANNLEDDPEYIDTAERNYHLGSSSPALSTGISAPSISTRDPYDDYQTGIGGDTDYPGDPADYMPKSLFFAPRPTGTMDLGAIEANPDYPTCWIQVTTNEDSLGAYIDGSSTTMSIKFSESVTGLTISDFDTFNCTLSSLTGSGDTYSVTVTPDDFGFFSVRLPAGAAQDGSANEALTSNYTSSNMRGEATAGSSGPGNPGRRTILLLR